MTPSSNCSLILEWYEQGPKGGFADVPYYCSGGVLTIGFGHAILKNESFPSPINKEKAYELLKSDLEKKAIQVSKLLKRTPTQDQFDALVSLAFNVGVGKEDGVKGDFADSSLLEFFEKGDFIRAGAAFHSWVFAKKKKLNGLVKRRRTESELFLKGKVNLY